MRLPIFVLSLSWVTEPSKNAEEVLVPLPWPPPPPPQHTALWLINILSKLVKMTWQYGAHTDNKTITVLARTSQIIMGGIWSEPQATSRSFYHQSDLSIKTIYGCLVFIYRSQGLTFIEVSLFGSRQVILALMSCVAKGHLRCSQLYFTRECSQVSFHLPRKLDL